MSNTVTIYIKVHDGGKLTVEDVNLAIHGEHPLPKWGEDENYYSATQAEGSEWIKVRTKWIAPCRRHRPTCLQEADQFDHGVRFLGQQRSRLDAVLLQALPP
jgi:hypothetical protein